MLVPWGRIGGQGERARQFPDKVRIDRNEFFCRPAEFELCVID